MKTFSFFLAIFWTVFAILMLVNPYLVGFEDYVTRESAWVGGFLVGFLVAGIFAVIVNEFLKEEA